MGLDAPRPAIYRFVVAHRLPHAAGYLADAHALGLTAVTAIDCRDLYFIQGRLQPPDLERLAARLLSDPIAQTITCDSLSGPSQSAAPAPNGAHCIEVALRPGVTDPVAEQIVRAAHELGITGVEQAATGQRFLIQGENLDDDALRLLAGRLLANPTIQWYVLGEIEPVFPQPAEASGAVETIAIRAMTDEQLVELSAQRRAALDLAEMQAIRRYFQAENRDLTDVEFETIAQTWSEHCVHKTFKAYIEIDNPHASANPAWRGAARVNNLLKTYLKAATDQINAPWVLSAFVDNAGIVALGAEWEVSFKVETHNHPSAIEPFGGANTGVGGVIRDVLGVSAKPIAATDVLCFGPQDTPVDDLPAGVLHPRRIRSGVVAGVQDYGNKIGIPTVSGAILYDPGYTANPLVFCGCVGVAPRGKHPRAPQPGDRVIVLGGRTGRDGLRGATFSSMTMDAQTGAVAGASVQIGAPITEKGLIEVILAARDRGLYHAVTDCGAGGLSSAVGEMASGTGADVDLQHVRLKYPGLAPWEIWLSEAQERMVLAVPPEALAELQALCAAYDVELTDLGVFQASGRLVVRYGGRVVLDLANEFLHEGIPQRQLKAHLPVPAAAPLTPPPAMDPSAVLLRLLAHPNIASKAPVIRIYDHEVQGGTVVRPLTGAEDDGPSDGVVLKPIGTHGTEAVVLGQGINPEYGKRSPYRMALSVVDEAVRNAVAAGADPARIALLDNFCWGDPRDPATLGGLVECARGCHDAALAYQTPFISGKDSLNNEYLGKDGLRHAIPPTLLISSLGILDDLNQTATTDLKQPGDRLYLAGDFAPHFAGSHLALVTDWEEPGGDVPGLPAHGPAVYRAIHRAIQQGWARACHDLSEGGLGVAAAEMCIGGRLGLRLFLEDDRPPAHLFGETNGCLLVEVSPQDAPAFERLFDGLPLRLVGEVLADPRLVVIQHGTTILDLPVTDLAAAWQGHLPA